MTKETSLGWATLVFIGLGIAFAIYPPIVQDKALGRICIFTASICLWLLWICCYMSQMNPMAYPEPPSFPEAVDNSTTH